MEDNCIAKFTMHCPGKKIQKLKIKGNHEAFQQGILMEPSYQFQNIILKLKMEKNGYQKILQNYPQVQFYQFNQFLLKILIQNLKLKFQIKMIKQQNKNQSKIKSIKFNQLKMKWIYNELLVLILLKMKLIGIKYLRNKKKPLMKQKMKVKNFQKNYKIKMKKQMELFAESMRQQQNMIEEINTSITDYTSKVQELAEKNKLEMEEFQKQKQVFLDEMQKLEQEQKAELEALQLNINLNDEQNNEDQKDS